LPATKDGGRWAIRGADFIAWTPGHRQETSRSIEPGTPDRVAEAAVLLGVTNATVDAHVRRGNLAALRTP
jgi:hypothetical protein